MWAEFIHTNLLLIEHTKLFFTLKVLKAFTFDFIGLDDDSIIFKLPGFAIIPIFQN